MQLASCVLKFNLSNPILYFVYTFNAQFNMHQGMHKHWFI